MFLDYGADINIIHQPYGFPLFMQSLYLQNYVLIDLLLQHPNINLITSVSLHITWNKFIYK